MATSIKVRMAGAVWLVVWCLFLWHEAGNPLNELALIRHGSTVPGFITDTWEDADAGDQGGTHWYHGAAYTYRLPDGREFTAATHGNGRLREELQGLEEPYAVEVEYLHNDPSVSRVKGGGCQTVTEWAWRKVGLGGLLLILLAAPGIAMLRNEPLE